MPAPAAGTGTVFRLARITALLVGCLVFLYACETAKGTILWIEVAVAGTLALVAFAAAWFEIAHHKNLPPHIHPIRSNRSATDDDLDPYDDAQIYAESDRHAPDRHRAADNRGRAHDRSSAVGRGALGIDHGDADDHAGMRAGLPDGDRERAQEFRIQSDGWSVRARVVRSGDLVFRGRDLGGTYPEYEWAWTFHHTTFPAIRAALGGDDEDLLDLLEDIVPHLDRLSRQDPGAWLHRHGIPATFRERGVSPTQVTEPLPVINPDQFAHPLPQPTAQPRGPAAAPRRPTYQDQPKWPESSAPQRRRSTTHARRDLPRDDYYDRDDYAPSSSHRRRPRNR
ncbi:hypothetical protein [Nocardia sp. NPDC052566]|uniref:hypothetical protein n=1 Tax=Nocardia sp. NPDC052566 TaxID=3364330 RepID=UPI0037C7C441